MTRILLLLALVLLCTGATYYVDADSDGGDGTTQATTGANAAWKMPRDVTGIVAGDSVLFQRGDVWRQAANSTEDTGDSCWTFASDGTSGNEIVIGAYGAGDKPVLSGAKNGDIEGMAWNLSGSGTNEYYATVGGGNPGWLEPFSLYIGANRELLTYVFRSAGALADSSWTWDDNDVLGYSTIYVRAGAGPPSTNIEIPQCSSGSGILYLSSCDYVIVEDLILETTNASSYTAGVDSVFSSDGLYTFGLKNSTLQRLEGRFLAGPGLKLEHAQSVTVDSCHFHSNESDGIAVANSAPAESVFAGFILRDTVLNNNYQGRTYGNGSGIKTFSLTGALIERCLVYENTQGGIRLDGGYEGGGYGTSFSTIQDNTVYGNGETSAGGIFLEVCRGNKILRNLSYNNKGHQICISLNRIAGWTEPDTIAYNVARDRTGLDQIGIKVSWGPDSVLIANNTVDSTYYGIMIQGDGGASAIVSTKIRNNIITNSASADICFSPGEEDSTDTDYNFLTTAGKAGKVLGVGVYGLTDWQARGHDANGDSLSPQYKNESADDFDILSSSPCVNAGESLGFQTVDFDSLPIRGVPDVGAFESGRRRLVIN